RRPRWHPPAAVLAAAGHRRSPRSGAVRRRADRVCRRRPDRPHPGHQSRLLRLLPGAHGPTSPVIKGVSMTTTTTAGADSKVLVCLNHGAEEPENVLIAYLVGVEALRAGKQAVMFLTKDAIHVATPGFVDTIDLPDGSPSLPELHAEYLASGGRLLACPVCV